MCIIEQNHYLKFAQYNVLLSEKNTVNLIRSVIGTALSIVMVLWRQQATTQPKTSILQARLSATSDTMVLLYHVAWLVCGCIVLYETMDSLLMKGVRTLRCMIQMAAL